MNARPLYLRGMGGLGDNVYQRPLVRHLAKERGELWLSTPYPELYADLPVRPVHWATLDLRCQKKNMARQPSAVWQQVPRGAEERRLLYALRSMAGTISEELERGAGTVVRPFVFDLPDFGPPPVRYKRPYAVIRPVSVRREWMNTARNCLPQYVSQAAKALKARGFAVVCVADIDGEREWIEGVLPEADRHWIRGELDTPRMMALVQHAAVVVGPVGWMVPTALAMRVPAVVISGGLGAHNAPAVLVDPRMDASRMRFVLPDPYCMCRDPRHACPKVIPQFAKKLAAALDEVLA